jgi:hypothetical protein
MSPSAGINKEKFMKLASSLRPQGVEFGAVSCEEEIDLCKKRAPEALSSTSPVIKLRAGSIDVDYEEGKEGVSLMEFLTKEIPSTVSNLRLVPQMEEFISKKKMNKVAQNGIALILFTTKFDTPFILKSVAFHVHDKAAVAEVRGAASNPKMLEAFDLSASSLPTLIAVCAGDEPTAFERYEGDLKSVSEIGKFVDHFSDWKRCDRLREKVKKSKSARRDAANKLRSLSKEELGRKRLSELKEACKSLGISTIGLLEKDDFIREILSHRDGGERGSRRSEGDDVGRRRRVDIDGEGKSSDPMGRFQDWLFGEKATPDYEDEEDRAKEGERDFNFEDLFSATNGQLLKKKLSELVRIVKKLGIATKGLLEKSDYVKAITDYLVAHKKDWKSLHSSIFDL